MSAIIIITQIGINQLKAPGWNSRVSVDAQSIEGLAADIKARGIQSPIEVEGPDDKGFYEIVYGTRRVAAAKLAGLATVPAIVHPVGPAPLRLIRNVRENMQRSDLTPFEQARACAALRETGLKQVEIATITGLSAPHVSNLLSIHDRLHPDILLAWEKQAPAARFDFLRELAKEDDKTAQLKAYDDEARRIAQGIESGELAKDGRAAKGKGKGKGNGSTGGVRVISDRFLLLLDLSKSTKTNTTIGDGGHVIVTKTWLRLACDWLCGQSDKFPPGVVAVEPNPTQVAKFKANGTKAKEKKAKPLVEVKRK